MLVVMVVWECEVSRVLRSVRESGSSLREQWGSWGRESELQGVRLASVVPAAVMRLASRGGRVLSSKFFSDSTERRAQLLYLPGDLPSLVQETYIVDEERAPSPPSG